MFTPSIIVELAHPLTVPMININRWHEEPTSFTFRPSVVQFSDHRNIQGAAIEDTDITGTSHLFPEIFAAFLLRGIALGFRPSNS